MNVESVERERAAGVGLVAVGPEAVGIGGQTQSPVTSDNTAACTTPADKQSDNASPP